MSYSIVIPSKNIHNLTACVQRLREKGERGRVIVVWDGGDSELDMLPGTFDKTIVAGEKPFIFSRNVNIGITAAGTDDVVILGDDGLLETYGGIALLSVSADAHTDYGVIAASVDLCGTQNQIHSAIQSGLRPEKTMLAFICVYIPRSTIDRVGLLDERFCVNAGGPGARGYGLEDDDYCWRVREAGLRLGVHNDVVVNHTTLPSTFRSDPEHPHNVFAHEAVFEQKWGRHPRKP